MIEGWETKEGAKGRWRVYIYIEKMVSGNSEKVNGDADGVLTGIVVGFVSELTALMTNYRFR